MGGWRLLRALGIKPEVCHSNEGHAAFAILERARDCMDETNQSFDVALAVTRAGNLFTTHTPVEAGFDRFPPELIDHYWRGYSEEKLGISLRALLALGRQNLADSYERALDDRSLDSALSIFEPGRAEAFNECVIRCLSGNGLSKIIATSTVPTMPLMSCAEFLFRIFG
jgi:glucan phosphorylase